MKETTPAEMIAYAHQELTTAQNELRDAERRKPDYLHTSIVETAQDVLTRAEYTFIRLMIEHGSESPVLLGSPAENELKEAIAAWTLDNDLRRQLESIAVRREHNPGYHAQAMISALQTTHTAGVPSLGIRPAAMLLDSWLSYRDAEAIAKQIRQLYDTIEPRRAQDYIDPWEAENDRDRAWDNYTESPGSPARLEPYAWPGGYPVYYTIAAEDGTVDLCPKCAAKEKPWYKTVQQINYEDPRLICEGCNERIPSAYAEDGPDLSDTRLDVWSERDRLSITLTDIRNGTDDEILTIWDQAAADMLESGELELSSNRPHFNARQLESDPKLHESVFNYAREHGMLSAEYAGDRDIKPGEDEDDSDLDEDARIANAETYDPDTDSEM